MVSFAERIKAPGASWVNRKGPTENFTRHHLELTPLNTLVSGIDMNGSFQYLNICPVSDKKIPESMFQYSYATRQPLLSQALSKHSFLPTDRHIERSKFALFRH